MIKFEHAENGEISINTGHTPLADAFTIGSMHLTKKRIYEPGRNSKEGYPTNHSGLDAISMKSDELITFLHTSIQAIGILLVNADKEEIRREIDAIAWLQVGLSELAEQVAAANSDMNYVLNGSND